MQAGNASCKPTSASAVRSFLTFTRVAVITLGISACVVSSVQPLSIPLVYKPNTKQLLGPGPFACSALSTVQVTDARTDKVLGERTHESKPLKAEVTAATDPATWAQVGIQSYLTQNGFQLGSGPKLYVSITYLRTAESILRRASYEAKISLSGQLKSPSGKTCWQGQADGSSGDYGYAGSIQDYQDTLNGALDAATFQMVQPAPFKNALCQCGN